MNLKNKGAKKDNKLSDKNERINKEVIKNSAEIEKNDKNKKKEKKIQGRKAK